MAPEEDTLPVRFPVTSPVRLPVTSPVKFFVIVEGSLSLLIVPVVILAPSARLVAVVAVPVTLPVTLPVRSPVKLVAVTTPERLKLLG